MINGIQHIGIGVTDRDKAYLFYNNALGFSVPMSKHSGDCKGVIPLIEKDEERKVVIALTRTGVGSSRSSNTRRKSRFRPLKRLIFPTAATSFLG